MYSLYNVTWVGRAWGGGGGGGCGEGSDVCFSVHIANFLEMTIKMWYSTSICPPVFIHPSIYPFIHTCGTYLSIHPSIYPFIHPFIYPSMYSYIYPSFHIFFHPSIYPYPDKGCPILDITLSNSLLVLIKNSVLRCFVSWPMRKLIKINFYKYLYIFYSEQIHIQNKVELEGKLKLGQLLHH